VQCPSMGRRADWFRARITQDPSLMDAMRQGTGIADSSGSRDLAICVGCRAYGELLSAGRGATVMLGPVDCHCSLLTAANAARSTHHHWHEYSSLLSRDIPIALATVSASMGAVVVVIVGVAFRAVRQGIIDDFTHPEHRHRHSRERAAVALLLHTSSIAMVALLLTPLFLIYNLAAKMLSAPGAVGLGLGLFSFSVVTIVVGLLAFYSMPPRYYEPELRSSIDAHVAASR
jgi:hypothetical protein